MYLEYRAYIIRYQSGDKEAIKENKKLDAKDKAKYGGGYGNGGIKNLKQKIKIHQQKVN